jgi:5-methylcytosine-specific restriction endonuclease McrA
MLKSCSACGKIHDSKHICKQRQSAINARQYRYKNNREIDKFRSSTAWKTKGEEIKERDKYLCQICIRKLYGTIKQYTYDSLSVHHAESLEKAWDKRLDNNNLITGCDRHHEMMESGEIPLEVVIKIINEQESK